MNDLNIATSRKVLFMEKMDKLKDTSIDAYLNRLNEVEARLWDVIEKMGVN